MRIDLASPRRRNPIGLTPLIDVVFILLLFFMLASHFHQWRALTLNAAERGAVAEPAPTVLVRVHDDGALDLNGAPLVLEALTRDLTRILRRNPDLAVQVESSDGVSLQTLVTVFDQLQAAGVREMNLQ